jgi:hypothetical protein
MTPVELLALAKLLKDAEEKKIRAQIPAGDYAVDFSVHVKGTYEVEEDYLKDPTVSVPWTEAYALLRELAIQGVDEMIARVDRGETITKADLEVIKTAGFLSENLIVDCIQQAFAAKNAPKGERAIIARVPEVEAAQERAKEAISKRIGKTPSKGRVLTDLSVEEIQPQTVAGSATQPQIAPEVSVSQARVETALPEASQTL